MAGVTRPMSQMRKIETKEALFRARKRILKYLVLAFLKQEGLFHTADTLVSEANLTGEYEVCDNIDLDIILQDYCTYYLMRFNKQPQFCRKVEERPRTRRPAPPRRARPGAVEVPDEPAADLPATFTVKQLITVYCTYYLMRFNKQPQFCRKVEERPRTWRPAPPRRARPGAVEVPDEPAADLPATFTVKQLITEDQLASSIPAIQRKPLAGFIANMPSEKKELVEMLYQDIIRPFGVSWDDVKGLDAAKSLLMESVVYPVRYPEVFTGLLEPWRGLLLHGAPGTGKTLLARVVAAESQCTFFNVSSSTIVNKWRGESEKIVKVLFEMASHYSPSIIFIDEVETLVSDRASASEHEASRRLKAQLLTELDGIRDREGVLFLLANSNMPWDIDPAMLRRLEKRIYIPLPDPKTRAQLFQTYLKSDQTELYPKVNFEELARKTEGYSGSDIKLVCKEALMANLRKILPNMTVKGSGQNRKDRVNLSDILTAIEKTKPVSKNLTQKHLEWQNEMGCS